MDKNIIRMKIAIADALIGMLDKEMEQEDFDPRNPAVKAELQRQRGVLVQLMEEGEQDQAPAIEPEPDNDKPPPVVVGLKALRLNIRQVGLE